LAFSLWCPGALGHEQEEKRPKLHVVLELLVSRRRRRWPKLRVVLELFVLSRRRRRPMLCVIQELWALRVLRRRRHPSPYDLLEILVLTFLSRRSSR
jgi:hypothetical protein